MLVSVYFQSFIRKQIAETRHEIITVRQFQLSRGMLGKVVILNASM